MLLWIHSMEKGDRSRMSPFTCIWSDRLISVSTFWLVRFSFVIVSWWFFFVSLSLKLDLHTAIYDQPNYFYCLVYGLLVYLSLFFYFMTCYTDPGYVPYRRVWNSSLSISDDEECHHYIRFQIPNWTGQMDASSDEESESPEGQQMTTNSNHHLRKCLLCNIEVRKDLSYESIFASSRFSNHYEVIIVIFVIAVCSNMIIMYEHCGFSRSFNFSIKFFRSWF